MSEPVNTFRHFGHLSVMPSAAGEPGALTFGFGYATNQPALHRRAVHVTAEQVAELENYLASRGDTVAAGKRKAPGRGKAAAKKKGPPPGKERVTKPDPPGKAAKRAPRARR